MKSNLGQMKLKIKELHPYKVCLFKSGGFYYSYGRDAYIISELMNYKLREITTDLKECAFPLNAVFKVESELEKNKVNYVLISIRNQYNEDKIVKDFSDKDYIKVFEKAKANGNIRNRIEKIYQDLLKRRYGKNFKEILVEIERILLLDERRKI